MCGIGGILGSFNSDYIKSVSERMISSLYHRGPDGNGYVALDINPNNKLLLVHTRLSIIDLNQNANQPMNYNKKDYWITFNGEIYNHIELREDLIKFGYQFKNKSDTEVILAAYDKWGTKAFSKFIGMWSFALWDNKQKRLVLSRDRLGIKPLYYNFNNGNLVFASEPHVVAENSLENTTLNYSAILQYLSYRQVIDGKSFFKNVYQVDAGTNLIFQNKKKILERYWEIPSISGRHKNNEQELLSDLDKILNSSVQYRMRADVPVGAFLSGGLDSSALVWQMSKMAKNPINTYSIGFKEKEYNEFEYSKSVALQCKTNHHEITLNEDDYNLSLNKLIKLRGTPLSVPNEIAIFHLTKIMSPKIKVVLSGEGADEVFGGYGRIFRSAYDFYRVKNRKTTLQFKRNLLKQYKVQDWETETDHFLSQYFYVSENDQNNILSDDFKFELEDDVYKKEIFRNYLGKQKSSTLAEKYMWIFQKIHIQGLLSRLDASTMANSIEGRVPFLDHRLIEFMNDVDVQFKLNFNKKDKESIQDFTSDQISEKFDTTKYLLRTLYKDRLPEQITKRKKIGFPVPLNHWLSGSFKEIAFDELLSNNSKTSDIFEKKQITTLLENKNPNNNGLIIWMLLNCELWMKNFKISV